MHTILITGGAGFIGSHLTRLFVNKYPDYKIVNIDALTYAGNLENLKDIENKPNYTFVKGDITDAALLKELFDIHQFTGVLHCAAESHVDRSITDPLAFITTNVVGTANLKYFTISVQMKYMAHWEKPVFLQKKLLTTHAAPTLLPKHHPITL
jgi:dTDP-glucose 4,6-dehydratase